MNDFLVKQKTIDFMRLNKKTNDLDKMQSNKESIFTQSSHNSSVNLKDKENDMYKRIRRVSDAKQLQKVMAQIKVIRQSEKVIKMKIQTKKEEKKNQVVEQDTKAVLMNKLEEQKREFMVFHKEKQRLDEIKKKAEEEQ